MKASIQIELLRRDLMNYYGAAIFAGFDSALEDLTRIDRATEDELIGYAKKAGFNINQYMEWKESEL